MGVGKLSKATDVYAFGVLLWEMYTGMRPWAGMMQMQVSTPLVYVEIGTESAISLFDTMDNRQDQTGSSKSGSRSF